MCQKRRLPASERQPYLWSGEAVNIRTALSFVTTSLSLKLYKHARICSSSLNADLPSLSACLVRRFRVSALLQLSR